MPISGYLDPAYATSMAADGKLASLEKSGGVLVVRRIPGIELEDAMAPYPFLVCHDWRGLKDDIAKLNGSLVSVTAITDPMADVDEGLLRESFSHLVRRYKAHFVINLTTPMERFIDPHHRGCARRALRKIAVELCENPLDHIAEWLDLYGNLVRRHDIRGPARMTEQTFRLQLQMPGLSMFRARCNGATIGMILCMVQGDSAYFHLGAYNEAGYRGKASYALVWSIIQYFAEAGIKTLNIGAGAGAFGDGRDGLTAFKRGWASGTRITYLCGRIIDPLNYSRLSAIASHTGSSYFPAYRSGAFS